MSPKSIITKTLNCLSLGLGPLWNRFCPTWLQWTFLGIFFLGGIAATILVNYVDPAELFTGEEMGSALDNAIPQVNINGMSTVVGTFTGLFFTLFGIVRMNQSQNMMYCPQYVIEDDQFADGTNTPYSHVMNLPRNTTTGVDDDWLYASTQRKGDSMMLRAVEKGKSKMWSVGFGYFLFGIAFFATSYIFGVQSMLNPSLCGSFDMLPTTITASFLGLATVGVIGLGLWDKFQKTNRLRWMTNPEKGLEAEMSQALCKANRVHNFKSTRSLRNPNPLQNYQMGRLINRLTADHSDIQTVERQAKINGAK